ncbi:insulinase family protein, partial [Escherichia coli]|uniref:insulinase family protein n=1 Tax=Escherichia coli TaxID=562 RepID=UPI0033156BEA
DDLVDFHHDWLRPQNGTLIVVGDTTLAEIVPLLDKQLGDWKAAGDAPQVKAATDVALPKGPRVFLIDQPGAVQANLFAGQVVAPSSATSSTRF